MNKHWTFIHVPKTAGSSLRLAMRNTGQQPWHGDGHRRLVDYADDPHPALTCKRNPYDRSISIFSLICQREKLKFESPEEKIGAFRDFVAHGRAPAEKNIRLGGAVLSAQVSGPYNSEWEYARPQVTWTHGVITLDCLVDHTLRFEHLDQDWEEFCRLKLEMDPVKVPHKNSSNLRRGVPGIRLWYDSRTAELIYEQYRDDFEVLGYPEEVPE